MAAALRTAQERILLPLSAADLEELSAILLGSLSSEPGKEGQAGQSWRASATLLHMHTRKGDLRNVQQLVWDGQVEEPSSRHVLSPEVFGGRCVRILASVQGACHVIGWGLGGFMGCLVQPPYLPAA